MTVRNREIRFIATNGRPRDEMRIRSGSANPLPLSACHAGASDLVSIWRLLERGLIAAAEIDPESGPGRAVNLIPNDARRGDACRYRALVDIDRIDAQLFRVSRPRRRCSIPCIG